MAFKKKSLKAKSNRRVVGNVEEQESGLGTVRFTRGLGRKRVVISNEIVKTLPESPITKTPLKRRRNRTVVSGRDKSSIESIPQELLIRVLRCVDHKDLKSLFHVSKSIREAALIAKQYHFAYGTPEKIPAFRNPIDFNESSGFDEIDPPNAPKQKRNRRSLIGEKVSPSISVVLFK